MLSDRRSPGDAQGAWVDNGSGFPSGSLLYSANHRHPLLASRLLVEPVIGPGFGVMEECVAGLRFPNSTAPATAPWHLPPVRIGFRPLGVLCAESKVYMAERTRD